MKRVIALACPCLAQAQEVAGRPALWTSHPNADAPPPWTGSRRNTRCRGRMVRDGTTKVMAKLPAEFAAAHPQPRRPSAGSPASMEGRRNLVNQLVSFSMHS